MSPGSEADFDSTCFLCKQRPVTEQLYRMNVIGLEDSPNGDKNVVYSEFLKHLTRSPKGWYYRPSLEGRSSPLTTEQLRGHEAT